MLSRVRIGALFGILLIISACRELQTQEDSHLSWFTGAGPTRGHEDLTRMGVDRANAVLAGEIGLRPFPGIAKGVAGVDSENPLVKGNYESDFPSQRMFDFYQLPSDVDWHHHDSIQHVHSLRDRVDGNYVGSREACERVRAAISAASHEAAEKFALGLNDEGLYWLGHATHILQDSFSPAHTERNGEGLRSISSFCTYGQEVAGICYHHTTDLRDRVWRDTLACSLDANNRGYSCLVPEAQRAVEASGGYLRAVGEAIFRGGDLDEGLERFYTDRSAADLGYFSCEELI